MLVTIDGVRWQEVFRGLNQDIAKNKRFTQNTEELLKKYGSSNKPAAALMPFTHSTISKRGIVYGNKDKLECIKTSNPWHTSYPGYNELLTGRVDPSITSNNKIYNPNISFLERLNKQGLFKKKVFAFASWDAFPYILNEPRSGIPVNAGFRLSEDLKLSEMEKALNKLQKDIPSGWNSLRLDAFTHNFALEKIKKDKPKIVFISYGEADFFASDGKYDQYILAVNRADRFIAEIWLTLQSLPEFTGKVNLLITTEHGRGSNNDNWQYHGSEQSASADSDPAQSKGDIAGSDDIWFAAIGPNIKTGPIKTRECLSLSSFAATAFETLGLNWQSYGEPLPILKRTQPELTPTD
ncbi:hypothetical protein SAMN02745866_01170 [Alteromonadaceae bacterium Bs31]|nr:hypothetical protein SAMN02745866_01170 [Alteromonadaceae bacterium Bs31]